ncbi:MAG TPA: hypothetical protein PLX89_16100 [Verrucomicrobiota bacterium]|nr:hypothetical protein [Verrucomicrobiales bacterium]HRI14519.1 hypothetical protein [Verrucomicrobiota bacterium]
MNTGALEQELTDLIARVERLEEMVKPIAKPTWRQVLGTSTGDERDREAARLGAEWRASEGKPE